MPHFKKLIPVFFAGIFCACSTAYHQAEFIRPSDVYIPSDIYKVGMINRAAGDRNTATIFIGSLPYDYLPGYPKWLVDTVLTAFRAETKKLNRFELWPVDWNNSSRNDRVFTNEPLSKDAIDSLCNIHQVDGLIVLEGVEMTLRTNGRVNIRSILDETGTLIRVPEFSSNVEISSNFAWRFYANKGRGIIDDFQNSYTFNFEPSGQYPSHNQLAQAIKSLSEKAALNYSSRVSPHWQSDYRKYYRSGTQALVDISINLDYSGNWQNAAEAWKDLAYKSQITKERYAANYNMALASEMLGQPKIAKEWLIKAKEINQTKQVETYLEIIDQQILIYDVVDRQLGLSN